MLSAINKPCTLLSPVVLSVNILSVMTISLKWIFKLCILNGLNLVSIGANGALT
jgi:hypothetical protein